MIGPNGHIMRRTDLTCANDEDAKKQTKQLVDGHAVELWQGTRLLIRFEPSP